MEVIKELLDDNAISKRTKFILGGGEPILHPNIREILSLFQGRKYLLLSNGLLPELLIDLVHKYNVKNLALSLDGPQETYRNVRGVDGYFKVKKVVEDLSNDGINIYITYTVNPWNTREDLMHVIEFCKKYGVYLLIGFYCNYPYFDTTKPAGHLYNINDLIDLAPIPFPTYYLKLYSAWISGNINIPCFSIFLKPVIRANGDVELCESKEIKLGNLYEQKFSEIWRSNRIRSLQRKYLHCNDCWADAQRSHDVWVISLLRTFIPTFVLDKTFGKYDWQKIPPIYKLYENAAF